MSYEDKAAAAAEASAKVAALLPATDHDSHLASSREKQAAARAHGEAAEVAPDHDKESMHRFEQKKLDISALEHRSMMRGAQPNAKERDRSGAALKAWATRRAGK